MNCYKTILLGEDGCNKHFARRYIKFIEFRSKNEYSKFETQRHHILPKAIWPEYKDFKANPWNCSVLSNREHFIAHWLLYKALPNRAEVAFAFYQMKNKNRERLNSKVFSALKERCSQLTSERCSGHMTAKALDGTLLYIKTNDPRYIAGELVGHMKGVPNTRAKGMVTTRDQDGNILYVPISDPRYIAGELTPAIVGVNIGAVMAKDMKGNTIRTSVVDPRLKTGELVGQTSGFVTVKDLKGNTMQVSKDDPRLKTGELVGVCFGMIAVRDSSGNTFSVSKDDPRLKTGELVHVNKGKMHAKDQQGNRHFISNTDPRLKTGELVHVKCRMVYAIKDGVECWMKKTVAEKNKLNIVSES